MGAKQDILTQQFLRKLLRLFVKRKPPAVPVVPKGFSYAQKKYPSDARNNY